MSKVKINPVNNPVKQLRELGYETNVTHYRLYIDWDDVQAAMWTNSSRNIRIKCKELATYESPGLDLALPRGGKTVLTVTDKSGKQYQTVAHCRSDEQFNKKEGVKEAVKKLLVVLNEEESHKLVEHV